MKEQKVSIENPRDPGSAVTSQKRAARFVRNGHAVYTAPFVIRLVETGLVVSVDRIAARQARVRFTGRGYDAVRSQFAVATGGNAVGAAYRTPEHERLGRR